MAKNRSRRSPVPDFRRRILANVVQSDDKGIVDIRLPELLRHLLLFDGVTIQSGRLIDLGHLVRRIGLDDALAVVNAGGFRIQCEPVVLARAGEPTVRVGSGGALRLERLDYGIVRAASHSKWLDSGFREAIALADLTPGRARKFENVVRGHLIPENPQARAIALEEAKHDILAMTPSARAALDLALRKHLNVGIPPLGSYRFEVFYREGRGYTAETDLAVVMNLPPDKVAAAVNDGLLGAVGINMLIDDIRVHEALTGMRASDLSVLNHKMASVAHQFDGSPQADRFTRVTEVSIPRQSRGL